MRIASHAVPAARGQLRFDCDSATVSLLPFFCAEAHVTVIVIVLRNEVAAAWQLVISSTKRRIPRVMNLLLGVQPCYDLQQ